MTYNPDIHHRRSIRLPDYDYSQAGYYFITICVQNRDCLLGEIKDGSMQLNAAGQMVCQWFDELENKFPHLKNNAFVCMPNHIHLVVRILSEPRQGQIHRFAPTGRSVSIPQVVQWFKTMTTNAYIKGVKNHYWQPFYGKLWQRNYWEHIVRDDKNLLFIRDYIINNPKTWENDVLNPTHQ